MAITIDWATFVINIPKADMPLVQTTPIEIRDLDINQLRIALRDLEDDAEGIIFNTTHNYASPTSVGGVTLAPVVEILEPYTVTFEDGAYAVNITGGNSNVSDRVNINNVSVRSANSAGLVQSDEIEYSSYQNGVTLDVARGVAGQSYPTGTPAQPVNNLEDAKFIAQVRGFDTIYINGTYVFDASDTVDNIIFQGRSATKSIVSLTESASITNCVFRELTLDGFLDGGNDASECVIQNLNYIDGAILDCLIFGTITLNGTQATILRCASGVAGGGPGQTAVIDMGGTGTDLVIRDYQGGVELRNHTSGSDDVSIDMSSGRVVLDSTITSGDYTIRGIASVEDNSTGTAVVNVNVLDPQNLNRASFTDGGVYLDAASTNSGTVFPTGTPSKPVNSIADAITIARAEGLTKIFVVGFHSLGATDNADGITFIGGSGSSNVIGLTAGCSTDASGFEKLIVYGQLGGLSRIVNCILGIQGLGGFTEAEGRIVDSIVNSTNGIVQKTTGAGCLLDNCSFVAPNSPYIPFDANGKSFSLRECTGRISVQNKTDAEPNLLHISGADLQIESSCTAGTLTVSGSGNVTDNSVGTTVVDTTMDGQLQIMNVGIQDSSILVPHTANIP